MEEILVCVSSPPEINVGIYYMWTEGKTVDECIQVRKTVEVTNSSWLSFNPNHPRLKQRNLVPNNSSITNEQNELLKQEIADQYRAFQILEVVQNLLFFH